MILLRMLNKRLNKLLQEAMKTYTLEEAKDKYLGKKGTKERDSYENELRLNLIGEAIKQATERTKINPNPTWRINWRKKSSNF